MTDSTTCVLLSTDVEGLEERFQHGRWKKHMQKKLSAEKQEKIR